MTSCSPTIITLSRPRFFSLPIAVPFVRETHCRRDHCQPLLTCTRRFSASSPPQMRCLTRIFHPNIDDTTGKICARCSFLLLFFVTPWLDPRLQLPRRLQVGSHPHHIVHAAVHVCGHVSRYRGSAAQSCSVAVSLSFQIRTATTRFLIANTPLNCC